VNTTTEDVNDNQTKTLKVEGFRSGQIVMPIGFGLFVLHFLAYQTN
jgi:hypothetical protein